MNCIAPGGWHWWGHWRWTMHADRDELSAEKWWRYERECQVSGCNAKQHAEELEARGRTEVFKEPV